MLTVALVGFWLLISPQRTDPLFVGMGVASAVLVALATHRILGDVLGPVLTGLVGSPARVVRHLGYIVWLLTRIPPAAVVAAWYILHPRMPIAPCVVRFRTHLDSPSARALLANSITLVPGTLTVEVDGDELTVHAFFPGAADDLVSGRMQGRIARVFGQDPDHDPQARWITAEEAGR